MIWKSRRAALLSIQLEYTPWLAAKHKIVRATIDGKPVGWSVVLVP